MLVQVPGPVPPSAAGHCASANWPTAPAHALLMAALSLSLLLATLATVFASAAHVPPILPARTPASHFWRVFASASVSLADSFATVARHLFPAACEGAAISSRALTPATAAVKAFILVLFMSLAPCEFLIFE